MSRKVGLNNLIHATMPCEDPDCEIHCPWVIEDDASCLTAIAWFVAGAQHVTMTQAEREAREYGS